MESYRPSFRRRLASAWASLGTLLKKLKPRVSEVRLQRMCPFCGLITPRAKRICLECGKSLSAVTLEGKKHDKDEEIDREEPLKRAFTLGSENSERRDIRQRCSDERFDRTRRRQLPRLPGLISLAPQTPPAGCRSSRHRLRCHSCGFEKTWIFGRNLVLRASVPLLVVEQDAKAKAGERPHRSERGGHRSFRSEEPW